MLKVITLYQKTILDTAYTIETEVFLQSLKTTLMST